MNFNNIIINFLNYYYFLNIKFENDFYTYIKLYKEKIISNCNLKKENK